MTSGKDSKYMEERLGGENTVWNRLRYDCDGIIEASAGTGKTYTLQSIVLKLVADRDPPVDMKNILLVTFTEKAAGELKDRIRKILEESGCLPSDFSEATICTIHSFCRELLRTYAFENRVPMQFEVADSESDFIHRAVRAALLGDAFKSKYADTFAAYMAAGGFDTADALSSGAEWRLGEYANGGEPPEPPRQFDEEMRMALADAVSSTSFDFDGIAIHARARPGFERALETIRGRIGDFASSDIRTAIMAVVDCCRACDKGKLNPSVTGRGKGVKLFDIRSDLAAFQDAIVAANEVLADQLAADLVYYAYPDYRRLKDASAELTFDDLVTQASRVIGQEALREEKGERSALFNAVRRRYRIALVDEFQDTDQKQWNIFRQLFSSRVNKLDGDDVPEPKQGFLLVVGDPKQAIYGFRGADVATYLAAKEAITTGADAQPVQTLKATYRSTREMIDGFNTLFGVASGWFDGMTEGERSIEYSPVEAPPDGQYRFPGLQDFSGVPAVNLLESLPWRLPDLTDNRGGYGNDRLCLPTFMENAAIEMKRLRKLPCAYTTVGRNGEIEKHGFKYGDMCVLVRGGSGARVVKRVLARHGIPYAHYKEAGLFATAEAEALLALFDFLAAPGKSGNLAALLLTPLFGVRPADLEALLSGGGDCLSKLLEKWQELAAKRDWNKLFESVMNETTLAHPDSGDFEFDRRWTATRQILDKLLLEVGRSALGVEDFASILRSWRKNDKGAGENGALRQKESEADRVQIMTMHASKGLEFGVVFIAAGMTTISNDDINDEKRLFYVALTRAEHKLYLPWTKWDPHLRAGNEEHGLGSKGSSLLGDGFLSNGIRALFGERAASQVIDRKDGPGITNSPDDSDGDDEIGIGRTIPRQYDIGYLKHFRKQWDSFTSLNGHGSSRRTETEHSRESDETDIPDAVEGEKTKSLLPRNNVSGTVFHEIMETLCGNDEGTGEIGFAIGKAAFADAMADEAFAEIVRGAMRRNAMSNQSRGGDSTEKTLMRMVWNALNTKLEIGVSPAFYLKDIPFAERRAEVEFVIDEATVLGANLPQLGGRQRDGVFNGSIDLVVRPGGKNGPVCILDWKTNTLNDYGRESVSAEMGAAGYDLQFKLYSLAVQQWLGEDALAGIAYLFVRGGEGEGRASGVYAKEMDADLRADCRASVRNVLPGAKAE